MEWCVQLYLLLLLLPSLHCQPSCQMVRSPHRVGDNCSIKQECGLKCALMEESICTQVEDIQCETVMQPECTQLPPNLCSGQENCGWQKETCHTEYRTECVAGVEVVCREVVEECAEVGRESEHCNIVMEEQCNEVEEDICQDEEQPAENVTQVGNLLLLMNYSNNKCCSFTLLMWRGRNVRRRTDAELLRRIFASKWKFVRVVTVS